MSDFFLRNGVSFCGSAHPGRGENPRKAIEQEQGVTPAGARALLNWAELARGRARVADVYREKEGRCTFRVQLVQGEYFVKLHRGVGWREIFKNLLRGKRPVLGAADEYRALRRLRNSAVSTPEIAAYAQLGDNPAHRRSVIVTDALQNTVSLDQYCAQWRHSPPRAAEKIRLIGAVARLSREMHASGVNHRDFYLCHIHLRQPGAVPSGIELVLIDLHRAQVRSAVPARWRVKDLAGLYFSAMDAGLTQRDKLRFLRHYTPGGLRVALHQERRQWQRVQRRAVTMHKKTLR